MTRAELIRLFALDSFCDDYEDIEQITKYMDDVGSKCGIQISDEEIIQEIIQALRELIEMGYTIGPADFRRLQNPAGSGSSVK